MLRILYELLVLLLLALILTAEPYLPLLPPKLLCFALSIQADLYLEPFVSAWILWCLLALSLLLPI